MKQVIVFSAISCFTLQVHAVDIGFDPSQLPQFSDFPPPIPLSRPSHTETFVIDPSQSYVKAYVPSWEKGNSSDPVFIVDDGEPQPAAFNWELHWTQTTFSLAGTFKMETVPSKWAWERSRLFPSQIQVTTDTPSYAAFGLPNFFAQFDQAVSYSSHPCFDHNFDDPPGWNSSCSGGQIGLTREDSGSLQGNVLALHGSVSSYSSPMVLSLPGTEDVPALPSDYSAVQGLFEYQLVAVAAVPEPETYALMLAGIGLVIFAAQRRRA